MSLRYNRRISGLLQMVIFSIVLTSSPCISTPEPEVLDNSVSGLRDKSLSDFRGKSKSSAMQEHKANWYTEATVPVHSSKNSACRNDSICPLQEVHRVSIKTRESRLRQQPTLSAPAERQEVMELMSSVSEELSGLRSALHHLGLHSQSVHRQVKRLHRADCMAARRARRRIVWTASEPQSTSTEDTNGYDKHGNPIRHHHHQHHVTGRCPAGFVYSPATSTCYLLRGEQVTWDTADAHCRHLGAQLVSIKSDVEQRQLAELARTNSATSHCDFWIGLRRRRSTTRRGAAGRQSSWQWTSTSTAGSWGPSRRRQPSNAAALYGHWKTGEPNDAGGLEDCAQAMWVFSWRWNDTPCSSSLACFACQIDPRRL